MKKFVVLLLVLSLAIFAMTGCDGIGTPNGSEGEGEGEGEGEEEVKQVVLVEAYVAEGCSYCKLVEPHLEKLADEYGRDEMILVEIIPWLSYETQNGKDRYDWYSLSGGTPQILFNGLIYSPLTGNASYSTIKSRIAAQLNATPKISIQATRTETNGTSTISGTIKNISNTDLSNLVINGMIFRSRGDFPYAVTDIFEDEKIDVPSLTAGETKNFEIILENANWDGYNLDGVIFVQETTGKKIVRQSLFID
jgi:thiol-disulfide isomerase/thioredoxin